MYSAYVLPFVCFVLIVTCSLHLNSLHSLHLHFRFITIYSRARYLPNYIYIHKKTIGHNIKKNNISGITISRDFKMSDKVSISSNQNRIVFMVAHM